jgi:Ca2+-binding EF-hand superfamily protein
MKAFNKLDKNGNGWIDIDDIRGVYDAKKHPDVLQGKKSED